MELEQAWFILEHGSEQGLPEYYKAIRVIKELLKKREIIPYIDIDEAKCPICKVKLTRQELMGDDVLFEDFFDFCPKCGKKVNWDAIFDKGSSANDGGR